MAEVQRVRHELHESEERFRLTFENAPIGIALVGLDGRWLKANRALTELVGYPEDVLCTKSFQELTHPDDLEADLEQVALLLAGGINAYSLEKRYIHADGHAVWIRLSVSLARAECGEPLHFIAQIEDIGERKRADELFRSLLESAPDAMVIVDDSGRIALVNRQTELLFGYDRAQLVGQPVEVLLPDHLGASHRHQRQVYAAHPTARPMGGQLSLQARRADGSLLPVEVSLSPLTTESGTLVSAAIRDITQRQSIEQALAHQAFHDALTGLPNRSLLTERLNHLLSRGDRGDVGVAVLFVDLDRFKLINDSRGHAAGDEVLVAAARRLSAVIRPSDTVARFGGDEFVVVCESSMQAWEATVLAQRISDVLSQPFETAGGEVFLSISIGIAVADGPRTAEALLQEADAAMYRAKERGRARIELFDETMRTAAVARLDTQNALHRAVERGELRVFYQPIVDLASGRTTGIEALVRWQHPERGLLGPDDFIPLAEETGLIIPVGAWVIDEATRRWARWRARAPGYGSLRLNVNLSAGQLRQAELLEVVRATLYRYEADVSAVCFELTESVVMDDLDLEDGKLQALRGLGLRLALDDFGTGYSSLTYLKRFPVDMIKIDRRFVAGITGDPFDAAIVESVIGLAHTLGMRVVAEGVETIGQLEALRHLGCDLAQGYLFSPPQPPDGRTGLLALPALVGGRHEALVRPLPR